MQRWYGRESRQHHLRSVWWQEQRILCVLGLLLSFAAGFSILISGSPVGSLIIAGVVVALGLILVLIHKPVWAVYGAILVVFLPTGLLPAHIQSLLNRGMMMLALGFWLLDVAIHDRPLICLWPVFFMLLFVTWSMVTLLWAPDFSQGIEGVFQYASRLVLFLVIVVNQINSKERLDDLMNVIAIGGWLLLILGVQQLVFRGYSPQGRLQVLDENINGYGILLLVMLPGVLWQVMKLPHVERTWRSISGSIYVVLALVLIALTGSRGSILSLVVALLLLGLWEPTRVWGIFGLLIVLMVGAATPFVFSSLIERVDEVGSLGGRLPIWQASWLLIRDRLWFGVGISNANEAVMPYLRVLTRTWNLTERSIHNPVLQVWAETGLFGLFLYLTVLLSAVFLSARQYLRRRTESGGPLPAYFALVFCVFIGYIISWIKGGGMEHDPSYFLMLSLLLIPSSISLEEERVAGTSFSSSPEEERAR